MDEANGKIHGSPTHVFIATHPAVVLVRDATMNAEEALPGVHFHVEMPIQLRVKNVGTDNRLPTGVAQRPYNMSQPVIVWRQHSSDALEGMRSAAADTDLRAVLASLETPEATSSRTSMRSRRNPVPIEPGEGTPCLATCRQTKVVIETAGLDPVQVEEIMAGCTARCKSAMLITKNATEEDVGKSNVVSSPLMLAKKATSTESKNTSAISAISEGFSTYRTAENRFRFTAHHCSQSAPSYTNDTRGECGRPGLPPGLIIDPTTARIYGMPELPARYTISISAMEEATGSIFLVNSAVFFLDVLECGNGGLLDDGNGGAATCLNGGMCKSAPTNAIGTLADTRFDGVFTCSCPTLFTGERCEARRAASRADDSDATVQVVSIAIVAFVIIVMLVVGMILRYNARIKRQAPIDFVRHWTNFKAKDPQLKIDTDRKAPKEIPRRLIAVQEILGRGAFGEVSKGALNEQTSRGSIRITVAIKKAKLDVHAENFEQQAAFVDLIQEAALMAQFNHHNVLSLIGVCTKGISDGQPLLLVIQYCEKGNLIDFMNIDNGGPSIKIKERLRICKEVAQGMKYLSSKNYVHRDLAARNVLVDSEFVCKICDFGLSRDMGEGDQKATYYRTSGGGALPVRWTALEALEDAKFTTASDVWSFGILAIEVFSDCQRPYYGMKNHDVWLNLRAGMRHDRPRGCPRDVFRRIMRDCWEENPKLRPTFQTLVQRLESMEQKEYKEDHAPSVNNTTVAQGTRQRSSTSRTDDSSARYVNAAIIRAVKMSKSLRSESVSGAQGSGGSHGNVVEESGRPSVMSLLGTSSRSTDEGEPSSASTTEPIRGQERSQRNAYGTVVHNGNAPKQPRHTPTYEYEGMFKREGRESQRGASSRALVNTGSSAASENPTTNSSDVGASPVDARQSKPSKSTLVNVKADFSALSPAFYEPVGRPNLMESINAGGTHSVTSRNDCSVGPAIDGSTDVISRGDSDGQYVFPSRPSSDALAPKGPPTARRSRLNPSIVGVDTSLGGVHRSLSPRSTDKCGQKGPMDERHAPMASFRTQYSAPLPVVHANDIHAEATYVEPRATMLPALGVELDVNRPVPPPRRGSVNVSGATVNGQDSSQAGTRSSADVNNHARMHLKIAGPGTIAECEESADLSGMAPPMQSTNGIAHNFKVHRHIGSSDVPKTNASWTLDGIANIMPTAAVTPAQACELATHYYALATNNVQGSVTEPSQYYGEYSDQDGGGHRAANQAASSSTIGLSRDGGTENDNHSWGDNLKGLAVGSWTKETSFGIEAADDYSFPDLHTINEIPYDEVGRIDRSEQHLGRVLSIETVLPRPTGGESSATRSATASIGSPIPHAGSSRHFEAASFTPDTNTTSTLGMDDQPDVQWKGSATSITPSTTP